MRHYPLNQNSLWVSQSHCFCIKGENNHSQRMLLDNGATLAGSCEAFRFYKTNFETVTPYVYREVKCCLCCTDYMEKMMKKRMLSLLSFRIKSLHLLLYLFTCLCVHVHVSTQTTFRSGSLLLPCNVVLGTELRPAGLFANTFTGWAILLAQFPFLFGKIHRENNYCLNL